ncbi:MAG: rhomboid family intramembrane serine protease [Acidobacteria bacterium]|nr:rhomboid family intramembrane serine protease [Acidobacteriota bacterium]
MIPIRDVIPSRTTPYVTFSLITANGLAFLYQLLVDDDGLNQLIATYALVPAGITGLGLPGIVTSMFLHAGPAHLLGNMLFLWIFGDNVEDRFGHGRFLIFYFAAGVAANLAQVLASPHSFIPILGASGAIAAVMGAYFVLFPRSRVVMLIWLILYEDFVEIPAVLFLGFWFIFQFIGSIGQTADAAAGGVAFAAHLGGFIVGVALGRLLARRERTRVDWWDGQPPTRPALP